MIIFLYSVYCWVESMFHKNKVSMLPQRYSVVKIVFKRYVYLVQLGSHKNSIWMVSFYPYQCRLVNGTNWGCIIETSAGIMRLIEANFELIWCHDAFLCLYDSVLFVITSSINFHSKELGITTSDMLGDLWYKVFIFWG